MAILKLDNVNSLNEAIELFKKSNKGQDESISDLTKIIINQQKIELERINLENAKIKNRKEYLKCKYCGVNNELNNSKCKNCGAAIHRKIDF